MGLEVKTIAGRRYYYYRYYYRLGGEKRYTERYIGSRRPSKAELRGLKDSYREEVDEARARSPAPREEDGELPVYLL